MTGGNIIFLNGTSSSGKSTLAKELQQQLEGYIHMSLDGVWVMLPEKVFHEDEWWKSIIVSKCVTGFHKAIAAYSQSGVGVIVDHCINSPDGIKECLLLFKNTRVVFVEVMCSVSTLREREKARGEQKLLRSFEEGEWKPVKNAGREIARHRTYARNTLRKDRRVNIRISSKDLDELQAIAAEDGLPYQTLMASVLHRYASGSLVESGGRTRRFS